MSEMYSKPLLITDFSNLSHQKWKIVNDIVMGGQSESHFQINADGNALFTGEISLKNSGGFASVKNHESLNLNDCEYIILHLKGDGKMYSFRIQTGDQNHVNPWSYEQKFNSITDKWLTLKLLFKDFKPTYRGSTPKDVPQLDQSSIKTFGFLISDGQEGEFRLEIERIEAV
jgi:NADH dehydrogenase [ubiquinone] 1 alpha subcomplex assembly factor 1